MNFLKKIFRFLALNLVFLGGLAFVFALGFIYALVQPSGSLVKIFFLVLFSVWVLFLIKYFGELVEKRNRLKNIDESLDRQNIKITKSSQTLSPKK